MTHHRAPAPLDDGARRRERPAVHEARSPRAPLAAVAASAGNAALARLIALRPAQAGLALGVPATRVLARAQLSDADRERIDDEIQHHADRADPDVVDEALAAAEDPDEAAPWLELAEDPTRQAFHGRVVLLLQESTATTTAQVDALLESAEETAEDEAATLAAIGAPFLERQAWAFPRTWSDRVGSTLKPPAGLEVAATAEAAAEAAEGLAQAAERIPADVEARGLPVAFAPALELRSFPFRPSHAQLGGDHAITAYAIAARTFVAAQVGAALAQGWAAGKQVLVADVAAGRKVVDAAKWPAFAAPRRYQPDLRELTDEALREDVAIVDTLAAEDVDLARHELALARLASTAALAHRLAFAVRVAEVFEEALARADALVAGASGDRRLELADAWADALGYPAAARALMVQALEENAGEIALDAVVDLGIGMLPFVGWVWRGKELVEEVADLIEAGSELLDARDAVEAARTVVALQRAAARLSLQENASMATVALSVAGAVGGKGKGGGPATGGPGAPGPGGATRPGTAPDAGGGTRPGTAPDAGGGTRPADPAGPGADPARRDSDPDRGDRGPTPDAGPVRVQRELPGGGTLKLLADGRVVLCRSPCAFLEQRYARELGDPTSARRARLAAIAQRERDAVTARDAAAEEAALDDAVALEAELRAEHRLYLGTDRRDAGGAFRPHEAVQGEHIEEVLGRPIEVFDPAVHHPDLLTAKSGDWWDPVGNNSYDGLGGTPQYDRLELERSIAGHVVKQGLDVLFIDLSLFTPAQRQEVIDHVRLTHAAHLDRQRRPFIKIYLDSTRGLL